MSSLVRTSQTDRINGHTARRGVCSLTAFEGEGLAVHTWSAGMREM